jgi:hypothetical protein
MRQWRKAIPLSRAGSFNLLSAQVFDRPLVEIVARSDDLHFARLDQIGDDFAGRGDLSGRALRAFASA